MSSEGLAPGTIRTRVNNVRSVLRAAVRDRMIPSDPSANVTLPRARRAEAAMVLPTVLQVGVLLDTAGSEFRAFVALCAFGGLRLGEAAAVQVGDVDFLHRQLRVTRQVQRAGSGLVEIRAPKYGSERTVFLPDAVLAILTEHIRLRTFGEAPTRWMFTGEPGDPPHQNTVGYWWRKTKATAGIENLRLHDLRHFYASGLIAAGCDVVAVQRALGHATATTTLNTYSHLWPSAEDRTRKAAGEMFAACAADPMRTSTMTI
jgi:integrase